MGKRMEESRARLQARHAPQPVVPSSPPPEVPTSVATPEPLKSCATCDLYPCALWNERPGAVILRTGQPFTFAALTQMPMLCGGDYWRQRVLSAWERNRRQAGPTGLSQFTKRNEENQ